MQLISSGIPKADAYGGVIISSDGKILLREPKDHFGGYAWTYAKGRPYLTETPEQAALRSVLKETGLKCRIISAIPHLFSGTTTSSAFFLMYDEDDPCYPGEETNEIVWATEKEARALIAQSPSKVGRARDLEILDAALRIWRSGQGDNPTYQDFAYLPRLFELVSVLHRRGYEKLRVFPYEYPAAYRLGVLPRQYFSVHNGAWVPKNMPLMAMVHSSAAGNRAFGWLDALDDTPEQLADKYILRFPEEAGDSLGSDPAYAAWFEQLLRYTRQGGFPAMAAEAFKFGPYNATATPIIYYAPEHRIELDPQLPLPPPGEIEDDRSAHSWTSQGGLFQALDLATQPNYLGSPAVVSAIVLEIIELSRAYYKGETNFNAVWDVVWTMGENLNSGEGYTLMPGWHNPDGIGSALLRYFQLRPEDNLADDMTYFWTEALMALFFKTRELLVAYAADPIALWEEQFQPQITALHDWAVSVFLGTNVVFDPDRVISDFVWIQDFRGPANQ